MFKRTGITQQYTYNQFLKDLDSESVLLFILRKSGNLDFFTPNNEVKPEAGDTVVSLQNLYKTREYKPLTFIVSGL